jgi:hypothetical protein
MVGLRKNFTYLLMLWVASGPLMLSWHYALDHQLVHSEDHRCCEQDISVTHVSSGRNSVPLPCPYQKRLVKTGEQCEQYSGCQNSGCQNSGCQSIPNHSQSPEGCCPESDEDSCRICELLLHDDLISIEWFELTFSERIALAEALLAIQDPVADVVSAWSVRGPPQNC